MEKFKYVAYILLGNFLLAIGVAGFIIPANIVVGGASGLSIVLSHLLPISLSMGVLIINLICLPLGYIFVGKELVIGSLLSSFIFPACLEIVGYMTFLNTICDDLLLATMLGGAISGIGIGLVMKVGASTGGMDIPPLILQKKLNIPVDKTLYLFDSVIMLAQLSFRPFNRVVYGIIYAYMMSFGINRVLAVGVYKLQVNVISKDYEAIRKALLENDFGVTLIQIQTGLEQNIQYAIQTVVFSKSLRKVNKIIDAIDPLAFTTIQEIRDVKGKGFTIER